VLDGLQNKRREAHKGFNPGVAGEARGHCGAKECPAKPKKNYERWKRVAGLTVCESVYYRGGTTNGANTNLLVSPGETPRTKSNIPLGRKRCSELGKCNGEMSGPETTIFIVKKHGLKQLTT